MGESKKRSVKKPFEALTIADNYMFQSIMRDKKKAKPLLEMVRCLMKLSRKSSRTKKGGANI